MLDFIHNKQDYIDETTKLKLVFSETVDFVNNPFLPHFGAFIAFEFDKLYTRTFYQGIMDFLSCIRNKHLTFYTVNPSPAEYFFKNFLKYSVVRIPSDTPYDNYIELLGRNPGDSPADALLHNAEKMFLFSDEALWGLAGSKDLEIGIVGFENQSIKNTFINSFKPNTFKTVKGRAREIEDILELDNQSRYIYEQIKANYPDLF